MCLPGALPPGVSATVQCFSGVHLVPVASVQQPDGISQISVAVTISVSSISQCKTLLCNALEMFVRMMTETPATFAAVVTPVAMHAIHDLLANAGFSVRPKPMDIALLCTGLSINNLACHFAILIF